MLSHAHSLSALPCAFRCASWAHRHELSCPTAMRSLCSSELPVLSRFLTISHIVVRPPLVWKTPDGPETRPDGWFRRTKGGGRPPQVLCGPAGQNLAENHQPSAPRYPRTLVMVQGATPDAAFRTNNFQIDTCKSHMERIRQSLRKINRKIWTVSDSWISIWRYRLSVNPKIVASFHYASFPSVCSRVLYPKWLVVTFCDFFFRRNADPHPRSV
jgi:hypothetical protein